MTVRTLWVTNDFPPRSGGIEQFVANLLARRPADSVCVITSRHPGGDEHDLGLPYPVRRVAARPLLPSPRLAARVRAEAKRHGADVVVFGAAWPLAGLAGAVDLPTFALTHGHEAGIVRVGGGLTVRAALRRVDAIGYISDFTLAAIRPFVPPGTAIHHLPPGVDVDAFHPGLTGAATRKRYGIPAQAPLVLCLSRLVARKGQDILVEGWARVLDAVPNARLLIAGAGPMDTELRDRVRDLALEESVTFTGDVRWTDLPGFHAAADVFAMPCRTRVRGLDVEGLGIVYLEAQATGTPVVAGRSGGAPEALVEGETGLVVDGRDVAAVADAVGTLLADAPRRSAMGESARRFVVEHYAWDVIAERFDRILHDLAAG